MKNEQKEIADVAMEIVGDVAENAHAEMQKPKFVKRVQGTITHIENYPDFKSMVDALCGCDKEPLRGDFEYHPTLGYVLTTNSRVVDK